MKFSVIVPVYNTAEYLENCIAALLAQDYPREDFEILLVDNNSTDRSPEILRSAPGIRALSQPKQGSYAARNCAIAEARGEYLAFTDSDCMPVPGWLRAIETAFQSPRTQVVLGRRRPARDAGLLRLLADYENKKDEHVFSSNTPDRYYGFTNNMAVRRAAMDRHGPFIERPRGADTIFVRRVVDAEGCDAVVYVPGMRVNHGELDGISTYYKKMYLYGRSRRQYSNIVKARPLSGSDRWLAFRETARGGCYSWPSTAALALLLAGGMVAWSLGSHSHRWSKRPLQ
jgi:glycosyltransferase involved in cell wall biosynthesis